MKKSVNKMRITRIIILLLIALIPAGIVFVGMNVAIQFSEGLGETLRCGTEIRETPCEYESSFPANIPNWIPSTASVIVYFIGFFSTYSKSKREES